MHAANHPGTLHLCANVLAVNPSIMGRPEAGEDGFHGAGCDAFHIIPRADDHINMHEYTMHLWTPWEGNYA